MTMTDSALLAAATAALVRLDERLAASVPAVALGWRARALIHEAAASARLSGLVVDALDLLLFDGDALDRVPDSELAEAVRLLALLRAAARRRPGRLFTPRRLVALTRARLTTARGIADGLDWLQERLTDPEQARRCLEAALAPDALASWRVQSPLSAAASVLAGWHGSGAAQALGDGPGRILAAAWPARTGLTQGLMLMPSMGFLGHSATYRPQASPGSWTRAFLEAAERAAAWGLELHQRLATGHARLAAASQPRRRTSHLPALAALLTAQPSLTPTGAARALDISASAARTLLDDLLARGLVREVSRRGSFRVFTLAH